MCVSSAVSSLEPASGDGDCGHVQATPVQYSCPVQSVYKYWDITTWKYFTTITVIYVSNAWILSVNSEEKVSLEFTIQLVWVVSLSDFTVLCCGFINLLDSTILGFCIFPLFWFLDLHKMYWFSSSNIGDCWWCTVTVSDCSILFWTRCVHSSDQSNSILGGDEDCCVEQVSMSL